MESTTKKKGITRKRRLLRVRRKVRASDNKARLCVTRSNMHLYAQLIDDVNGKTLVACNSLQKEIKGAKKTRKESAFLIGETLAKKATEKGVKQVVFDRGVRKYHGLIAQIADGARSGGLQF